MLLRANRQRQSDQRRTQVLPNAAVVYAVQQHVEETFEFLRSEERLSLPSGNVMVALASVGQLLGLVEGDIERLLNLEQKESSFVLTGMSYSEFLDAVRCLAVLHGHLALEALPALQVPDLSHALYNTYSSYSQALRPHASGAQCQCRLVAGEPPPRMFLESFVRMCRDAGFVQPQGPMPLPTLERIWMASSSFCEKSLPEHMCFGQFLRALAVVAGQIKAELFVTVAALGLAQELPALKHMPNTYRLKHYKEVSLNLGGTWSLPHLTFEALASAVRQGRNYEYSQFIRHAQQAVLLDELQQQQWRAALSGDTACDANTCDSSGYAAPGRGSTANAVGGGPAAGAGAGRVRPWSAGLTVLSPHARRPGSAYKADTEFGAGAYLGAPGGASSPRNLLTGGAVVGGWVVGDQGSPPAAYGSPPLASPPGRGRERSSSVLERDDDGGGGGDDLSLLNDRAHDTPSASVTGGSGGGRLCFDSRKPRVTYGPSLGSSSSRPSTSSVPSPAAGDRPRPGVSRLWSARTGGGGGGPGGGGGGSSLGGGGGGGGQEVMSGAGGGGGRGLQGVAGFEAEAPPWSVTELRREVEGRLGALEEQGRGVMRLLAQLQAQMGALLQQSTAEEGMRGEAQARRGQYSPTFSFVDVNSPQGNGTDYADECPSPVAEGIWPGGSSTRRLPAPLYELKGGARYAVVVRTSDQPGAGTDADVYITLYGATRDTGERLLLNSANNFERGRVSAFVLSGPSIGDVQRVRVRSSSSTDPGPNWHLEAIDVASSETGTRYAFPFAGWLNEDCGIEAVISCSDAAPLTGEGDDLPPGWRDPPAHQPPQQPPQQQPHPHPQHQGRPDPTNPRLASVPRGAEVHRHSMSSLENVSLSSFPVGRSPSPTASVTQGYPGDGGGSNPHQAAGAGHHWRSLHATAGGDAAAGAADGSAAQLELLAGSVGELQHRMQQLEAVQAESAKRAAATTAAAVLVRVPSPLLAAVRYGRNGAGTESGNGSEDSALLLLADLLKHLHARAEQGVAEALEAGAQAATALDASRQQEGRLSRMQTDLSATSQVAEAAAARTAEASERTASVQTTARPMPATAVPQDQSQEDDDMLAAGQMSHQADLTEQQQQQHESSASSAESGAELRSLAAELAQCKARVASLSAAVKRLTKGNGDVAAVVADVDALLVEVRAHKALMAASLTGTAASLASLRAGREHGRGRRRRLARASGALASDSDAASSSVSQEGAVGTAGPTGVAYASLGEAAADGGLGEAGGDGNLCAGGAPNGGQAGPSMQGALEVFREELVQLAKMVAAARGGLSVDRVAATAAAASRGGAAGSRSSSLAHGGLVDGGTDSEAASGTESVDG